jgi:hypothetical protein
MDPSLLETDVLLRLTTTLLRAVDQAIDRLLSLLPIAPSRALATQLMPTPIALPMPALTPEPERAEDLAIQQALDEVLEYHRTHRPKNTTKNYEPKQKEWRVSPDPCSCLLFPPLIPSLPYPLLSRGTG